MGWGQGKEEDAGWLDGADGHLGCRGCRSRVVPERAEGGMLHLQAPDHRACAPPQEEAAGALCWRLCMLPCLAAKGCPSTCLVPQRFDLHGPIGADGPTLVQGIQSVQSWGLCLLDRGVRASLGAEGRLGLAGLSWEGCP